MNASKVNQLLQKPGLDLERVLERTHRNMVKREETLIDVSDLNRRRRLEIGKQNAESVFAKAREISRENHCPGRTK